MLRGIGEKVGIAVGSAIILGVLALLWNTITSGGLVAALGGVTQAELAGYQKKLTEAEQAAAVGHPHPAPTVVDAMPSGAVMAFDTPSRCPEGWEPFAEGQGRMLVGASFGMDDGLFRSAPLTQRKYRDHGGQEQVVLSAAQMPSHFHNMPSSLGNGLKSGGVDYVILNGSRTVQSEKTGGLGNGDTSPHPNMPPYIALYFCKKT